MSFSARLSRGDFFRTRYNIVTSRYDSLSRRVFISFHYLHNSYPTTNPTTFVLLARQATSIYSDRDEDVKIDPEDKIMHKI